MGDRRMVVTDKSRGTMREPKFRRHSRLAHIENVVSRGERIARSINTDRRHGKPPRDVALAAPGLCCTGRRVSRCGVPARKTSCFGRAPLPDINDSTAPTCRNPAPGSPDNIQEATRMLRDEHEQNSQPPAYGTLHTASNELRAQDRIPSWDFPELGISASQHINQEQLKTQSTGHCGVDCRSVSDSAQGNPSNASQAPQQARIKGAVKDAVAPVVLCPDCGFAFA